MSLRRRVPSASTLFVFEVAARLGNFSRAAEELNITQPAVSHAIAALEKHLEQKLFVRSGPHLTLTDDGERLSRTTTRAFAQIESVIEDILDREQDREVVMLSLSSGMVAHWLMPRYDAFRQAFPGVDLQFQLIPGSVGGPLNSCDLGLRVAQGKERRKLGGWFAPERVMAVGAPGYLRDNGTLDDPTGTHTLIHLPKHWYGWSEFAAQTGKAARGAFAHLSFPDYAVVIQSALSGQGLALGWTSVVSRLIIDGVLAPATDAVVVTDRSYHLVSSSQRSIRPCVNDVRDWLIAEMEREERIIGEMFGSASPAAAGYS